MAGITVSEKTYEDINNLAYSQRTSKKDIAEKMTIFVIQREAEFIKEMF